MNNTNVGQAARLPDAGLAGAVQSVPSPSLRQTSPLRTVLSLLAVLAAAGLLAASLKLPLWHLKMEAPQYREQEALRVRIYPGSMAGDLREIKTLNQYIGVHVPEQLPQLRWLPLALLAAAGLGVASAWLPRRLRSRGLLATALLLCLSLGAAAALAQRQMHQIGHDRDHHPILKGVPDFTPPLLGSEKVANFEITTGLGAGAGLIAAGIALQCAAAFLSRRRGQDCSCGRQAAPVERKKNAGPLTLAATNQAR